MPEPLQLPRRGLRIVGATTNDRYLKTTATNNVLTELTPAAVLSDIGAAASSHTHLEADITDLQSYMLDLVDDTSPTLSGSLELAATASGTRSFLFNYSSLAILTLQNLGSGDLSLIVKGPIQANGNLLIDGTSQLDGNVTIGDGTATDFKVTFSASAAIGTITFDQDPGQFVFSHALTIVGGIITVGDIVVTGTVDSRDVASDGTKLDAIEALADVTDATNVAAAGAMFNLVDDTTPEFSGTLALAATGVNTRNLEFDSASLTTLSVENVGSGSVIMIVVGDLQANSKLFVNDESFLLDNVTIGNGDATDYTLTFVASANDGVITWDQDPGQFLFDHAVVVTGNIVVSGTVDGRDVAVDGTKLDAIEALADVTDATNVDAAGALMTSGGTITGDLTVDGEMKGSRMLLGGGNTGTSVSADSTLNGISGVKMTTGDGYVMSRPGSIVSGSFLTDIVSYTSSGTLRLLILVNDAFVFAVTTTISSTGKKTIYATQARGADTFVAGDRIRLKMDYVSGSYSYDDTLALCEVVFDT